MAKKQKLTFIENMDEEKDSSGESNAIELPKKKLTKMYRADQNRYADVSEGNIEAFKREGYKIV